MTPDEIKHTIDLAAFIRGRGIELKTHGRDLIGLCPFHKDSSPSLVVTPSKQLWHCMGCDRGGSVIDFVMAADGIDLPKAIRKLAGAEGSQKSAPLRPKELVPLESRSLQTVGERPNASRSDLPRPGADAGACSEVSALPTGTAARSGAPDEDGRSDRDAYTEGSGEQPAPRRGSGQSPVSSLPPERANQLFERVVSLYEKTFADVPEGRAYLEGRGITDAGLFGQHRVGYCNGGLPEMLPSDGPIWEELKALGLLLNNGRERFTGCVVVPVFNEEGDFVTLYGRNTVADSAKRHLFLPDRPTGTWNLVAARTYADLVLVESVIDALSLEMAGYHNVLSIQGTNGLKDADIATLEACGVRKLTLLLDADDAGRKASERLKGKLSSFSCELRTLPENHDPNSFLTAHGAPTLAEFLATPAEQSPLQAYGRTPEEENEGSGESSTPRRGVGQSPASSASASVSSLPDGFAVTYGLRRYEIRGLEKGARKLRVTVRVEHAGKLHVDTLDLYSARARRVLCQDVARIFEQGAETVEADLTKLMVTCEAYDPEAVKRAESADGPTERMTAKERKEAEEFGKSPELFERILADFATCGLVGEKHNKLLCYLAAVSRKMDVPLSVLVLSSSGAGKTALQDAALAFCPEEDVLKLTSLTGKALFYKDETSLKHRVLALEEGAGAEEASYAIRNLISAGELVIEATIKDLVTGKLTTMENRVQGPTSVFYTVTDPEVDPETRSRFFVIGIDESPEQTRAILRFQRQRDELDGLRENTAVKHVLNVHRNFQRLLRPLAVVNPYASQLTYGDSRLQARRDQPKYLNLIKVVAYVRQMQKELKSVGNNGTFTEYIEVDLADIAIANELATTILGTTLDELSVPSRNLLGLLEKMVDEHMKQLPAESAKATDETPERHTIPFSRKTIRRHTGWSNYRVHTHLKELVDYEYVLVESGRNGSTYRYRLAYDGQGKDGEQFMLGLKDVAEFADATEGAEG